MNDTGKQGVSKIKRYRSGDWFARVIWRLIAQGERNRRDRKIIEPELAQRVYEQKHLEARSLQYIRMYPCMPLATVFRQYAQNQRICVLPVVTTWGFAVYLQRTKGGEGLVAERWHVVRFSVRGSHAWFVLIYLGKVVPYISRELV